MTKKKQETVLCQICKEQKKISEILSAEIIREPIVERIKATHPDWSSEGFICISDLNHFRAEYVQDVLFLASAERTGYLFSATSCIKSFISRTAFSIPTSTAREMMLCPM